MQTKALQNMKYSKSAFDTLFCCLQCDYLPLHSRGITCHLTIICHFNNHSTTILKAFSHETSTTTSSTRLPHPQKRKPIPRTTDDLNQQAAHPKDMALDTGCTTWYPANLYCLYWTTPLRSQVRCFQPTRGTGYRRHFANLATPYQEPGGTHLPTLSPQAILSSVSAKPPAPQLQCSQYPSSHTSCTTCTSFFVTLQSKRFL